MKIKIIIIICCVIQVYKNKERIPLKSILCVLRIYFIIITKVEHKHTVEK